MHTLHLIAVEAADLSEARSGAEAFLEEAATPVVADYFVIGGRWETYLDGKSALCYADAPDRFRKVVRQALEDRNRTFRGIRDRLAGRAVTATDIPNHVFGLPIADKEAAARLQSEENARWGALFRELLERDSLPGLPDEGSGLGYHLSRLGELVSGDYNIDSRFYDAAEWTADTDRLWERCEHKPERQWLVAADMHS